MLPPESIHKGVKFQQLAFVLARKLSAYGTLAVDAEPIAVQEPCNPPLTRLEFCQQNSDAVSSAKCFHTYHLSQ